MSEPVTSNEKNILGDENANKWAWVPGILFKPRSTSKKIVKQEKSVWQIPLIILSIISILVIISAAPIRRENALTGAGLPEGSEWWSDDQMQKYREAQQNMSSATFMYLFPTITRLLGIWFNWMVFSSVLYLSLTLAGSRAPRVKSSNLVAWAMVPLAFRSIVELILIFARKQLPTGTALAMSIGETKSKLLMLVKGMLGQIDAYWVWFVVILFIGVVYLSSIKKSKAVWVTILVVLIMLVIQGLPTLVSSYLSGLSGSGFNMNF